MEYLFRNNGIDCVFVCEFVDSPVSLSIKKKKNLQTLPSFKVHAHKSQHSNILYSKLQARKKAFVLKKMKFPFAAMCSLALADTVSARYAIYFPFISKFDRPRPPPTPCQCYSTHFMVMEELLTFFEHVDNASEMHCTLATASDEDELNAMRTEAATYIQPGGVSNMFIGLIRATSAELAALPGGIDVPANDPTNGDTDGPWMWNDGCTDYDFNPFLNPGNANSKEPNNQGIEERTGAIRLIAQTNGLNEGDILDIPAANLGYPALYECCD